MASVSALSISRPNSAFIRSSSTSSALSPLQFQSHCVKFQNQFKNSSIACVSSVVNFNKQRSIKIRAVAEDEETLVSEEETLSPPEQTVSVPVSPSDVLTMFFQAEGAMSDAAIPAVIKALEEVEGVADLKVQVIEGLASVELTKQTTVQATGVASNLVEAIQGSGFKLQTLNLSFQDEEDFS